MTADKLRGAAEHRSGVVCSECEKVALVSMTDVLTGVLESPTRSDDLVNENFGRRQLPGS